MKKLWKILLPLLLLALLLYTRLPAQPGQSPAVQQSQTESGEVLSLAPEQAPAAQEDAPGDEAAVVEDGEYTTAEDLALYIHLYGHLPSNFITKKQAEALGWDGGSLEPFAPGKSIGGGYFGNYEGLLPAAKGRKWTECDVNTRGAKSRGPERLVFSNDGLIYYSPDHYESFTLLYGEP